MANFTAYTEVDAFMTRIKILFPFNAHTENLFLHSFISLILAQRVAPTVKRDWLRKP